MEIKRKYILQQERIKPKSCNNYNKDKPYIHTAKPKLEIQRKYEEKKELGKAEIMKGVEENGEINKELVVDSFEIEKTWKVNKITKR